MSSQAPAGEGLFLKGLAVVDDVAYFGGSEGAERRKRNDPHHHSTLLAFDLHTQHLLWRRPVRGMCMRGWREGCRLV